MRAIEAIAMKRSLSRSPCALGLLPLLVACGGSNEPTIPGSGGGAGAPSDSEFESSTDGTPMEICPEEAIVVDPTAIIDDMEDGNGTIAMAGMRNGSWWVSSDGTSEGSIEPPADAAPLPEKVLGGHCGSEYAIRVTGQGFTDWGAVVSLGFRYVSKQEPIDASEFSGVQFWARTGELHTGSVRIQFQDSTTHPEGGLCDPEPGSTSECYDGWGTDLVGLAEEWKLFKIPFARVGQRGYGQQGDAIDLENLYGIDWNLLPNTIFDLWLDDVWFYE